MNLYCDNYAQCQEMIHDRGGTGVNETHARAKGWHIFHGHDTIGRDHDAVLGPRCSDARRRALSPAPPLQPGQIELFQIEAVVDEAGS
jgi:hypothetical protein